MHLLFYVYWILNELVSRPIGARLVITFFSPGLYNIGVAFFLATSTGVCFHKLVGEHYLHAINYSQLFKQYSCKLYVVKI